MIRMDRQVYVDEARRWIGLPWQHQASLKGVACDCVGLIRGVYKEVTGITIPVVANYPATWHLFKSEPWLYNECCLNLDEIPIEEAGKGDVFIFKYKKRFPAHHIALFTGEGTIIHSYLEVGKVVESHYTDEWKRMTCNAFRFREVSV